MTTTKYRTGAVGLAIAMTLTGASCASQPEASMRPKFGSLSLSQDAEGKVLLSLRLENPTLDRSFLFDKLSFCGAGSFDLPDVRVLIVDGGAKRPVSRAGLIADRMDQIEPSQLTELTPGGALECRARLDDRFNLNDAMDVEVQVSARFVQHPLKPGLTWEKFNRDASVLKSPTA